MNEYQSFHRQSRRLALCGLMTALSVVLLSMGSFIPLATFACPMLAMLCLIPVICEFGPRTGQMVYAAAAPLALLLVADKELAFFISSWAGTPAGGSGWTPCPGPCGFR